MDPHAAPPTFDTLGNPVANPITGDGPTRSPSTQRMATSPRGMVASDSELCSQMGSRILERGGSAADAAITVALCIGVVNSFSSGIGGGAYILSRRFNETAVSIDARETAPQAAHRDMYKNHLDRSQFGGLAVAVPGELQGLYELYRMHSSGVLTWAELFEPVISLCYEGFPASTILEFALNREGERIRKLQAYWEFAFRKGRLLRAGEMVTRPALARTLQLIATNGSSAVFYDPEGPIVPNLVALCAKFDGVITAADFATYTARVEPALRASYLGRDVYTTGGASSGPVLIAGLNILNGYGEAEETEGGADCSTTNAHRMVETFKYMAAVRSNLGDVVDLDVNGRAARDKRVSRFATAEWAQAVRANISDVHTLPWQAYNSAYRPADTHGTASFSVVDAANNSVVMTTTVNLLFGSMLHDPVTGVILNNEMDDFSVPDSPNAFGLEPAKYNYIAPGRRPLSSMAPVIVVGSDGAPDLMIGAAGGSRITTAVLQAVVRTYSYHLLLLETIAFPRLHHQLFPDVVFVEAPVKGSFVAALREKGHKVAIIDHLTAMNGIRQVSGSWVGVSDWWRKRGIAVGC